MLLRAHACLGLCLFLFDCVLGNTASHATLQHTLLFGLG